MTYQETLQWMFGRLPMFQRQGAPAYKKDLGNIKLFCEHLGHPENKFKSIHIAGTNGKGSTSHMVASILQEAGYKTGLYTSPHLKDFRERIKIDGHVPSEEYVVEFIAKHKDFLEANDLSFFELTVGMAFDYFAYAEVDVAVIEVGLGGRLDATNIITPLVSVITNIGKDHTQFLGETLKEIAGEKAGIIKSKVPVVIGEKHPETQLVFIQKAVESQAEITFASAKAYPELEGDLKGAYQQKNKKTVLATIETLQAQGAFLIAEKHIHAGLKNTVKNTGLMGRWQILGESPKVICDTGHNKEGLTYVLEQLRSEPHEHLHIVLGVVSDKDLTSILPMFPKDATYYFSKPDVPRGLDVEFLAQAAAAYDLHGKTYTSVNDALASAKANAKPVDLIFVGGSTFTVAEVV